MMLFWIIAAAMTLAAALAAMMPFLRAAAPRPADASAHDIEVYRDQLAELDRDRSRGLIEGAEAEEARAEIGRRILRESDAATYDRGRSGRWSGARFVAGISVLAVPLVSWGLYAIVGSPGLPSEPLAARLQKSPDDSSIEELVARAEKHLAADPDDGRGWDVLAPVYFRLQRYDDAVSAYRNAIRLSGATPEREAGLGEAVTADNNGVVSSDAESAFKKALSLDPDDRRSRFFLAMAHAQEGDKKTARDMWNEMMSSLPQASPWRGAIERSLAQLDGAEKGAPAADANADAGPGPGREQVAAASEMTPDDRKQMVEGMVARLDKRLRDQPDDPQGWRRLVRSYMVLGRRSEALSALKRGLGALGDDTGEAAALRSFAGSLGLDENGQADK